MPGDAAWQIPKVIRGPTRLERIRAHLAVSLSIGKEDFDAVPVLRDPGGWKPANKAFDGRLQQVLEEMNEALAA
jgi:type I restriction enzyme, R subunit